MPSLKNFVYDVYFFSSTTESSQVLEFDVSQYFHGLSFIYGTQCRIAGGHKWDIWDNIKHDWVSTGIACNPANNAWNHWSFSEANRRQLCAQYESITLNGVTHDTSTGTIGRIGPLRLVRHHCQVSDGRQLQAKSLYRVRGQVAL